MQKFIRVMAIIAAVLVALSLLLLLVSIPLQRFIAGNWLKYPESLMAALPIFPLADFFNCFLLLACVALLIVCCGNQKGGIWLEILMFLMIAVVLPLLNNLLANVQNVMLGQLRGDTYVAANSAVNNISHYCMASGNLGRCIALATCGMSIAFKRTKK